LSAYRPVIAAAAALALLSLRIGAQGRPPAVDAEKLFNLACSTCHDGGDPRAPGRDALRGRSPAAIVDALTAGSMRYQGLALTGAERRAIAEYVTGRKMRGAASTITGRCPRPLPFADPQSAPLWNGWGADVHNTHFQPSPGLTADQIPKLALKWAFGFPDSTSSWGQPTVAGGRVFVGSQNAIVYSLDAKTGCIAWTFVAHAGVRGAVTIGPKDTSRGATRYAAYFSDQQGYAYAVDAASGKLLWSRKVDDHPLVRLTGAPVYHAARLYVPISSYEEGGKPPGYACCTFRGGVVALDARTGDQIWRAYTIAQAPALIRTYADGTEVWGPSGGAVWSSPTIDAKRNALYVGVGNTYSGAPQSTTDAIVAFDLATGRMKWAHQTSPGQRDVFGCTAGETNCSEHPGPDFDFGASPILATLPGGRELIIAGQKSGVVYALDPDRQGAEVWHYRAGGGSGLGGIQWGIAADGERVYVPVAEIYNEMPGGLHAVSLATGAHAWYAPPSPPACGKPTRACSGAQFSAVSVMPGIVFSPSNDGAVRAYSTADGTVVWSYDTNRTFRTVNGVAARGGSMAGPAPTIAGGMLFVSSGYGAFGLRPGNVLLAFAP